MRSTGFIGPADEIMQHWLARTRNRTEALAARPDIITEDFFTRSIVMSCRLDPKGKYGIVKRHISQNCFYRRNKKFDVVAFPDGESLVRSGLPLDRMFFSAGDGKGCAKKSAAVKIAIDDYDEYFEFMPHATDIDFLAEALFSPSVTSLEIFKGHVSDMILSGVRKSPEMSQWLWEAVSSSMLKTIAGCAFRLWASAIKSPKKDPELPKLTPIFATLANDLCRELLGERSSGLFSEARSRCMSAEEKNCLKTYTERLPEGTRKILGAFIKEAVRDTNTMICRNGGPNTSLSMAGSADIIMLRTGNSGNMDHFIRWIVRTSSMFPDTIIYALALERWTMRQLKMFEQALTESGSGTLVIWTSAQESAVPSFLMKNDFTTGKAYEDGGFCFRSVAPEPPSTYLKSIGVSAPLAERLEDYENRDGKHLLYEMGFISKELSECIMRDQKDPFSSSQVNIPREEMPVLSPYMTLPDDTIEKVRYKALRALQLDPEGISKAVLISDAVPEFYGWIAEAMENRAKVPKLNYEELKKKRKERGGNL